MHDAEMGFGALQRLKHYRDLNLCCVTLWPQETYLTGLCLSFVIYKMGIVKTPLMVLF